MFRTDQLIIRNLHRVVLALPLARALLAIALLPGVVMAAAPGQGIAEGSQLTFARAVAALNSGSFADKRQVADQLAQLEHPRVMLVLEAFIERDLFARRSDGLVVIAVETDGGYEISDAATGEPQGVAGRRDVRRVATNNSLRAHLRLLKSTVALSSPDPQRRLAALQQLGDSADEDTLTLIRERLPLETDSAVLAQMQIVLALAELRDPQPPRQLAAIATLAGQVDPEVRSALNAVVDSSATTDPVRVAAEQAIRAIDSRLNTYQMVETLFFGLSLGSVLVLAAIGLAITFGVMGVINMAHGELIMLGAYTAYVMQLLMPQSLALALLLSIPVAFIVSGGIGVLIERGVIRFLYGRPLETLLATFGISLILQQAVRSVFSPLNRAVASPEFLSGSIELTQGLSLTSNRLYVLAFTLVLFGLLLILLNRTRLGLEVRAVAQNREMARAMGVRTTWVDAMTFGLGSGIAGIAGVALSQLTNVGPNLGQAYIVDSFLVVVFGGVGNLWGTLVAGMSLGVVNKFLEPYAGAVMAKILVLIMIILFIQKRPRGLFPQLGRAVDG